MALPPEDVPVKLENHELRITALEKSGVNNRAVLMWLLVLAVQVIQTAIMYARH